MSNLSYLLQLPVGAWTMQTPGLKPEGWYSQGFGLISGHLWAGESTMSGLWSRVTPFLSRSKQECHQSVPSVSWDFKHRSSSSLIWLTSHCPFRLSPGCVPCLCVPRQGTINLTDPEFGVVSDDDVGFLFLSLMLFLKLFCIIPWVCIMWMWKTIYSGPFSLKPWLSVLFNHIFSISIYSMIHPIPLHSFPYSVQIIRPRPVFVKKTEGGLGLAATVLDRFELGLFLMCP